MQLEGASAPLSCGGRNGRERKRAPSPRRLIPFHTVGNPRCRGRKLRAAPGALCALLCSALPDGRPHKALRNNNPARHRLLLCPQWWGFLAMQAAQALSHGLACKRKWERRCFLEKNKSFFFFFFFSEMGMKRQTAQTIRFSHAHECPTSRSPG